MFRSQSLPSLPSTGLLSVASDEQEMRWIEVEFLWQPFCSLCCPSRLLYRVEWYSVGVARAFAKFTMMLRREEWAYTMKHTSS
jgi:hypothetical protein